MSTSPTAILPLGMLSPCLSRSRCAADVTVPCGLPQWSGRGAAALRRAGVEEQFHVLTRTCARIPIEPFRLRDVGHRGEIDAETAPPGQATRRLTES